MRNAHARCECGGILQIHPTRVCNLACAHCYSSSSPSARDSLPRELIIAAIEDAAALGFNVVSLSGGEPLAYDGLGDVVDAAQQIGCRVNLVSNGILIRSKRYERVAGQFGVIALSLDGLAERHNAIRGSEKSFDAVQAAASELRSSKQRFGIIHTLCSESLSDIETLAAIASDWGAAVLQLHPFEASGRGAASDQLTMLSEMERIDAVILAAIAQQRFPEVRIQLDLVHRDVARRAPAVIHGAPLKEPIQPRELVLQEDGAIVPLTYGIDPAWTIANLRNERLSAEWTPFIESKWPQLRRSLRLACVATARGRHGEVVAWHPIVRAYASRRTEMLSSDEGASLRA